MELQNLHMGRKCIQLYLKILIVIIIIVLAIHLIKSHSSDASIFHESERVAVSTSISSIYKYQPMQSSINVSNSTISTSEPNSHTIGISFVLALNYYEQLTCGTRNLFILFQVAQNFDAKVVIPFLWNSVLHGIPDDLVYDLSASTKYYPFHIVYNIHRLNKTFHSTSGTYFVTFTEMIKTAPRGIVVIDTQWSSNQISVNTSFTTNTSIKVFNCKSHLSPLVTKEANSIKTKLYKFTKYFNAAEFVTKVYICISPSVDTTTDQIRQLFGAESRTVIFTQWRGCAYHSCDVNAPRRSSNDFRHRILYHSVDTVQKMGFTDLRLPYNDAIKVDAKRYLQNKKISNPYISIHIRTEKLAQVSAAQRNDGYTDCCLSILDGVIRSLKDKYPSAVNRTVTITDVGKYGSNSCRTQKCLRHAKDVQSRLSSMGLTLASFDPAVTGSSKNPAYVSLVEMNMLAMGDLLIVMGKGSFKNQIISEFLQSNPVSKVYHICTEHGNKLNNINSTLDIKCL